MKVIAILIASLLMVACGKPDPRVDDITLVYLNRNVFAKGAVVCKLKPFGERTIVGCRNETLDGVSNVHLWEFRDSNYYAINGTARGLAEGRFASEHRIKAPPLPLPPDIDISAMLKAFEAG